LTPSPPSEFEDVVAAEELDDAAADPGRPGAFVDPAPEGLLPFDGIGNADRPRGGGSAHGRSRGSSRRGRSAYVPTYGVMVLILL